MRLLANRPARMFLVLSAVAAGLTVLPTAPASALNGLVDDAPPSAVVTGTKLTLLNRAALDSSAVFDAPLTSLAVRSKSVSITTQIQQHDMWCAPAAGRAALSALLVSPPSQTTLAGEMRTSMTTGTLLSRIAGPLNAHQTQNFYVYSSGNTLTGYRNRVLADIDNPGAPLVLDVEMSRLPWYAGTTTTGGHAVTGYGYRIATKVWTMSVYDPWIHDNQRHTGVASSTMYNASLQHDLYW